MKITKILPIIGISIFVYLIYKTGIKSILNALVGIDIFYLILAILFSSTVPPLLLAYKWGLILRKQNINLNFFYLLKIYLIGVFYGAVTPARAGSLVRASYLKRKLNKPFIECASSIVLERLLDLFALFVISIFGCFLLTRYTPGLLYKMIVAFIVFTFLSILFLRKKKTEWLFQFSYKFLMPKSLKIKFGEKLQDSFHTFYDKLPKLRKLVYPLLITILTWIIVNIGAYIVIKAFSINISIIYVITFFSIATVIGTIPITVAGLGTREATLIMLFGVFSISAVLIMSISLIVVAIGWITSVMGLVLSLTEKRVKKDIYKINMIKLEEN